MRTPAVRPLQAELIPVEELDDGFWAPEEAGDGEEDKGGRYTAKRFFLKRPQDYRLAIELLAAGAGLLKIARLLHVHHRTVAAVRDAEGVRIDIQKEKIRRNLRLALEIASERLPDIMAELPKAQVPVAAAILADKLAQMDGEPTARVEISHNVHLSHEKIVKELESLKMGLGEGSGGGKGGGEVVELEGGTDSESVS